MTTSEDHQTVDAVITWVDGNDPKLRHKRCQAIRAAKGSRLPDLPAGLSETRFKDNGELEYCIHSIRKYAGWIRTIHLVTDNQTPSFLTPSVRKHLSVKIVDHSDIFEGYEWALPTFNTRTIETALWRTPELASQFIYFNDDFLINNPVNPESFFQNGSVVCRGQWRPLRTPSRTRLSAERIINRLASKLLGINRTMHLLQQMKSAQLGGMTDRYFRIPHVPHPINKKTLEDFFALNPSAFEANIRYRFRNENQFSAIFLAYHLEIRKSNAIRKTEFAHTMISGERDSRKTIARKLQEIRSGSAHFVCLQSIERLEPTQQKDLHSILSKRIMSLDDS